MGHMAGNVRATEPEPLEEHGESTEAHLEFPRPRQPGDGTSDPQRPRPRPFASSLGPVGVMLIEAAARREAGGPDGGAWTVQQAEGAVDALIDALPTIPTQAPAMTRSRCVLAADRMPWTEILALLPHSAVKPTGHGLLAVLDDAPSARRVREVARTDLHSLRDRLPDPAALRTVGAFAVAAAVVFFSDGPLGREPEGEVVQRCALASLIADSAPRAPRSGHGFPTSEPTIPRDPAQLQAHLADLLTACSCTPAADPELSAMRRAHAYAVGYRLRLAQASALATGRRVAAVDEALRTLESGGAVDTAARRLRPRWYTR